MAGRNNENSNRLRSIRLTDTDVETLLDKLDTGSPDERARRRQHERFAYRLSTCKVKLQQPGAMVAQPFTVSTRDISAGGMSFLHGNFVHSGTRVIVQLITQHGTWADIQGDVVRCDYVEGGVHEVCVRFDQQIQPSDFCAAAMTFRVLLAEDDDAVARLATHHLEKLNAEVERVANGEEAVTKALEGMWDCVLMDMEMPVMTGFEATKSLRDRGYTGRIIAMTALTRPEDHERCLECGCNQYVPKPVAPDRYRRLLDSLRQEPITSSYQNDDGMRDMISEFVENLPQQIRKLEELLLGECLAELETELRALKGVAGGYGFEPISIASGAAETELHGGADAAAVRELLDEVINLCMLARAPGRNEHGNDEE